MDTEPTANSSDLSNNGVICSAAGNLRIHLLGEFRVEIDGRPVPSSAWRLGKARSLVQMLALAPGYTLHREQVMETLWPDADPHTSADNYRQVVHAARRALRPEFGETSADRAMLHVHGGTITLDPPGSRWIDVDAFAEAAADARRSRNPTDIHAALELWNGELLPASPYEDWLSDRRIALHETAVWLLNALVEKHEGRGEVGAAIETLQRIVELEPAHEAAHVGLMRLFAITNRPALAMRQYQLLQDALRTHLDAEPTLSTRQLHDDIATGHVTNDNAPKIIPLHSSLPKPMTSFIGRNADVTEVSEHVRTERLVTLIGAGGCGKSRLALEVATKLRSEFPDGVGFVELASVSDPELVPQTIAVALGLDSGTRRPSATTVAESLRTHRALIVMDNCEHLITACAKFAAKLLSDCSSLHILATSQERLRIEGEFTWRVPSLSTPEDSSELHIDQALQSEAIQLFVDRATRLRPDFDLNARNVKGIVEISRRLDGLPLAIELAAARVNVLAPEEIAMRLDQALHLLVTSDRERSERHQTLRAALGWSYGLLSEPEQKTLRRLAVFAGGWSLEAAEAVLPDGDVARADVVNLLSNLTDRSLVRAESSDGWTRYDLLDTVRQYALERLQESGEWETMRQRHAEHLAMLAEAAEPELHGPDQADWLKRFDREIDNLRAALAWARDGEHASIGFRLCWGMWRFWNARGYLDEGRRWMNSFLVLPREDAEVPDRVRVLFAAARFAMLQSDDDQAIRLAVECRDTASQIQDRDNLSGSLTVLGHVHLRHGEPEPARIAYEGALSVREQQGDQWGVAISIMSLARVAYATGDYARAIELYESSRAMFLTTGDSENAALSLCRRAEISLELGEFEVAERLLQDGLNEFRAIGNRVYLNECLIILGRVEIERGNLGVARELLAQALTSAQQLHALREVTSALEGFALLATIHGRAKHALLLAAATDRLRAQTGDSPIGQGRSRLDTELAACNRTLNPVERAAAVARGRLIGIDRAVVLAMSDDDE